MRLRSVMTSGFLILTAAASLALSGCGQATGSSGAAAPPEATTSHASSRTHHTATHTPKPALSLPPTFAGGTAGVYYSNMVVVLTWHNIAPQGIYDTIATSGFAAQMQALAQDHFHPIRPRTLLAFLGGHGTVPVNAVLLTFDNGCTGVYRYGFPIMQQHRFPFLLFPVLGRTNRLPGFFTGSQIRAMLAGHLATLGSHTFDQHNGAPAGPSLSGPADVVRLWNGRVLETWSQYDARVLQDAQRAQQSIRHYAGTPEPYFSDPFGQYTPRLLRLLAQAGFRADFTTYGWAVTAKTPLSLLPRINVGTGASTAASMIGGILTVAKDTAHNPTWYPPQSHVILWK